MKTSLPLASIYATSSPTPALLELLRRWRPIAPPFERSGRAQVPDSDPFRSEQHWQTSSGCWTRATQGGHPSSVPRGSLGDGSRLGLQQARGHTEAPVERPLL